MGAKKIMAGVYLFEGVDDPAIREQAAEDIKKYSLILDKIDIAHQKHGWESPQCQLARIEMHNHRMKMRQRMMKQEQQTS